MQRESRAIVAFGTAAALFLLGVFIVPRLVHGAGGVAALPTVPRVPPAPLVAIKPVAPTTPRIFGWPSLSKTQIAFSFAGEIWTVPREGGIARRLVGGQRQNAKPIFSPDGTQIAFTGTYDSNTDVYVVSANGGEPHRLTYQPGTDIAVRWSPDGSKILFASDAHTARDLPQLYTVPVTGGLATELPLPSGVDASYSPDATHLAYQPFPQWQEAWKHYRGGQYARIWIADLADSKVTKLPKEGSNDKFPMWVDNTIYFLSDRDGPMALYAFDVGGNAVREVAKDPDGFDLRSAQAGPGGIVFERVGQLSIYDFATKQAKPVQVTIVDDLPQTRPRFEHVDPDQMMHVSLSPTGKRVLVEAHGEILSVPVEKGDTRNLTQSPAIADRDPAWSPDGKWIAWLSDRTGEYALYFMQPDGLGDVHTVDLGKPASFYYSPRWSPDSKKIVLTDKRVNLWLVDIDHPTPQKVDSDLYDAQRTLNPSFSPDSRWISYVKALPNHLHAVFVYSLESKKSTQLTDGLSDAWGGARFDRSGKYIWFLASTDVGPAAGWLDMTSNNHPTAASVYGIVLRKDTPSPVALESDEEGSGSSTGKRLNDDKDKGVRIDFDQIDQRIVALPIERANYAGLEVGGPGVIFLASAPIAFADEDLLELDEVPLEITRFDLKSRKAAPFLPRVTGFGLSADGEKVLYQAGHQWFVADSSSPPKPGEGAVPLGSLEVWVDPRAEWKQMYHEVWRIERDFLYDPHAHGLDLAEAERVYAPLVDGIASRADLDKLFTEMLGNLVLGHTFIASRPEPEHHVSVGMLGADYTVDHDHYRISHIYRGENYNPHLQAPLTQPGVIVKEGDYLLEVNGEPVSVNDAPEKAFLDTAGKQTTLTLAASPDGHDKREVIVVPEPSERELRLRSWMEANKQKVDQLSGGKLAYVWVPDTAAGGTANFDRYFFSQIDKQGVIVDERFNHGGQIADFIVNTLQLKPSMVNHARDGAEEVEPAEANYGPKVMIANEMSGSGGDALPWLFKRAKIGPLVGTRTWGGLVGIGDYPPLIDGGMVTAPRWGLYSAEGKWDVENKGVTPDVLVEQDPALVRQGHDPQLERAVELALAALKTNPPPTFHVPPFPDYGPRLPHPNW
jgi:tricorn protease